MTKLTLIFILIFVLSTLQGCAAVVVVGVAGGVALAHDKRNTQTIMDDQSIEHKIYNKISEDKEFEKQTHISVISYNGVVLLTGETPQVHMREKAAEIARNTDKVKRVYNAIKVMQPTSLKSRNNDTWITTRVKSKLLGKKETDGLRIKVITENATVYLMGIIPKDQADFAADLASSVEGVKSVVKVFEYVD
jgi:osmotically-inducible protein OsmY